MEIQSVLEVALTILVILAMIFGPTLIGRHYKKQQSDTAALLKSIEANYSDKPGMLCSSFDQPEKGLVQFFGTILNNDLTLGMNLSLQGGMPWTIKEIYLDRHDPDKTSDRATAHTKDAAVVVEDNNNFDEELFKQQLVSSGLVYLKSS